MNWSVRPDKKFRLAIGSFVEEYNNKVCLKSASVAPLVALECQVEIIQLNEETGKFANVGNFDHPYPTTKIMWLPDKTDRKSVV